MPKTENERIDEIVDLLGCSIAEAKQIIADDKAIDKGERMSFDLTPEQEKQAKKYANVREHKRKTPASYKWEKRERKADTTKEGVIEQISQFLTDNGYQSVEILNKSKLISFKIGEDTYEFDLKRKRKPKS
jgi:hypothetical protein